MKLAELNELHRDVPTGDGDIVRCRCGAVFRDSDMWANKVAYYAHVDLERARWLAAAGFMRAVGWLTPGLSCELCGAVIGLPDQHREVCG